MVHTSAWLRWPKWSYQRALPLGMEAQPRCVRRFGSGRRQASALDRLYRRISSVVPIAEPSLHSFRAWLRPGPEVEDECKVLFHEVVLPSDQEQGSSGQLPEAMERSGVDEHSHLPDPHS